MTHGRVRRIETDEVQRLHDTGALFLEVLPREEYDLEHIPGAVSMPLGTINSESMAGLDHDRPIVTYCYNHECDLSSRAAAVLVHCGFTDVFGQVART